MIETFIKNIEKIFRYLVPAFVFLLLLAITKPCYYETYFKSLKNIEIAFLVPLLGMTIYAIHRMIFEWIDFIIIKYCHKKKISDLIIFQINNPKESSLNLFYYKFATIHSALITSELGMIFSSLISWHTKRFFAFIFLFAISLVVYFGYHKVQIEISNK